MLLRAIAFAAGVSLAGCSTASSPSPLTAEHAEGTVHLGIAAGPVYTWNGETLSVEEIEGRMIAREDLVPMVIYDLRPDWDAPYAAVARIMELLQRHSKMKVGVVGGA